MATEEARRAPVVPSLHRSRAMKSPANKLHRLVAGGDWACAHGDGGGLGDVAHQLVEVVPPSLRQDLHAIERMAEWPDADPFAAWAALRPSLLAYLTDDASEDRERATS